MGDTVQPRTPIFLKIVILIVMECEFTTMNLINGVGERHFCVHLSTYDKYPIFHYHRVSWDLSPPPTPVQIFLNDKKKKTWRKSGKLYHINISIFQISSLYILAVFTSRFSITRKHYFRISNISDYFLPKPHYFWYLILFWFMKTHVLFLTLYFLNWSPIRDSHFISPGDPPQFRSWKFMGVFAYHIWVLSSPSVAYWVASGTSLDPEFSVFLGKTKRLFILWAHGKHSKTTFAWLDAIREVVCF